MNKTWRESLRPRIEEVREALSQANSAELVCNSGVAAQQGRLELLLFGRAYVIRTPEFVAIDPEKDEECPEELQILLLDYLKHGDGTQPTGRWIGFQELKNGSFYKSAFQGYSGDQLVRDLNGDTDSFCKAAERLGGEAMDIGDAAYSFCALPHLPMVVVWWAGDEEFPAKASVLFDAAASHYLPTDGLAILGRMLCRRLAKLGKEA